jgi:8-oxo-dGTP diphosphatase
VDGATPEVAPDRAHPSIDVMAAGGIVRRKVGRRDLIAVVRRNRYGGDWTLPKGHVEAGETLQGAATREVREETGWEATPVSLAGATTYSTAEGDKYVLFWLMDATQPTLSGPEGEEVVAVEWLPYRAALRRLSYAREVEIVATLAPKRGTTMRRLTGLLRDPRPGRLEEQIQLGRSEVASRSPEGESLEPRWPREALACLYEAEAAHAVGDLDRGWALVHRAHRLTICGYSNAGVTREAMTVRAELPSPKFSDWRRRAIAEHIEHVLALNESKTFALPLSERRAALKEALRVRDENYDNEYQNLAIVRRYHAILLLTALIILISTLVGSAYVNPRLEGVDRSWVAVGAALSGALGGITSALQRTTRRSIVRIPERIGSLVHSFSRPVIGAIAGVTVFLAVRAGMTQTTSTTDQQVAYLLLLAFGAGFSERLVVRDPKDDTASAAAPATPTNPVPPSAMAGDREEGDTVAGDPAPPAQPIGTDGPNGLGGPGGTPDATER